MQRLQPGQFLQPRIRHFGFSKVQVLQVLEPGQLLQPGVRNLAPGKVQTFLNDLRADKVEERGISARSYNGYLGAIKSFTRWLVRDRRLLENLRLPWQVALREQVRPGSPTIFWSSSAGETRVSLRGHPRLRGDEARRRDQLGHPVLRGRLVEGTSDRLEPDDVPDPGCVTRLDRMQRRDRGEDRPRVKPGRLPFEQCGRQIFERDRRLDEGLLV